MPQGILEGASYAKSYGDIYISLVCAYIYTSYCYHRIIYALGFYMQFIIYKYHPYYMLLAYIVKFIILFIGSILWNLKPMRHG